MIILTVKKWLLYPAIYGINEFYPVLQDGKSKRQMNVFTLNKLNELETAEQKDRFCLRWRMYVNKSECLL